MPTTKPNTPERAELLASFCVIFAPTKGAAIEVLGDEAGNIRTFKSHKAAGLKLTGNIYHTPDSFWYAKYKGKLHFPAVMPVKAVRQMFRTRLTDFAKPI